MSHYVCHPIIRSLGLSGAHKGPNSIFKMMRLNVWHMHCWHNSSLYYLISKHVCCGSDGWGKLPSCGHQQERYRRITMLVHIHRERWNITQDHPQRCTLTPPRAHTHPPCITIPVSLTRTHIHTPTCQPRGSPISSSPSWFPLSSPGVRRSWMLLNAVGPLGLPNSSSSLKNTRLSLCVSSDSEAEDDLCRQDSLLRRS